MIARLDADRQAAVRLCLIVVMLPIVVGVAAGVCVLACGMPAQVGALMVLTVAACGITLCVAAYDWLADRIAAWLLARTAPAPEPERIEPGTAVVDALFRRTA